MKKTKLIFSLLMLLNVTIALSQVTLSLPKSHYQRGEDVVVTYENGQQNNKDWIGIAPQGQEITGTPGGYTTTYAYLTDPSAINGTATIPAGNFSSAADGYYYAVYLLNDGYQAASEKVHFYLGENEPITNVNSLNMQECIQYSSASKTLKINNTSQLLKFARVYSIHGLLLSQINLNAKAESIDLSPMKPGVYIIEMISSTQERQTLKIFR